MIRHGRLFRFTNAHECEVKKDSLLYYIQSVSEQGLLDSGEEEEQGINESGKSHLAYGKNVKEEKSLK